MVYIRMHVQDAFWIHQWVTRTESDIRPVHKMIDLSSRSSRSESMRELMSEILNEGSLTILHEFMVSQVSPKC